MDAEEIADFGFRIADLFRNFGFGIWLFSQIPKSEIPK